MFFKEMAKWFIAFIFLVLFCFSARADFRVCNLTKRTVGVAIGYPTLSSWISEGWWQIEPSCCSTLVEGNLLSRFYYLYAEDELGSGYWNGQTPMCVGESEFKIFDVKNCFARGFQQVSFQEIDTGNQTSWMVQLTNSGNNIFFSESSPITGIQKP